MTELIISDVARETMIAHARSEYPKESCGLIVDGAYQPCFNYASEPEKDFLIPAEVMARAFTTGKLEAVAHSHPNGPQWPTGNDMTSQMATAVPWIIIPLDAETVMPLVIWGDQLPIPPIIGREFVHGVTDCYSLIRDTFRLGKDELEKEGVEWPFPPQDVPDFARDDSWWAAEQNLYADNFEKAGFYQISQDEARIGDVFLGKIKSDKLNHGGVLIGGGLLMHHLPARLSRREPAGIWRNAIEVWLRYTPTKDLVDAS